MAWMKHFTYLAFIYAMFEYRGANGTKGTCICSDAKGVYNLTPLQSTDEYTPRFTIHGVGTMRGYMYGYNPCTSFIKRAPPGKPNYCLNDVGICQWPSEGGIPINIGNQSTAKCSTDSTGKPQLVYHSNYYPGKQWNPKVTLICNWTMTTVKEATLVQSPIDAWTFFLTHKCACPNGCRSKDKTTPKPTLGYTTTTTITTTKPTPSSTEPSPDSHWKYIWEPVAITAGGMVFVFIVIIVIWLLLNNNANDADERRRLIDEEGSIIDESRNIFTKTNEAGNTDNLLNAALRKSVNSNLCGDIMVPSKDDKDALDKTGEADLSV